MARTAVLIAIIGLFLGGLPGCSGNGPSPDPDGDDGPAPDSDGDAGPDIEDASDDGAPADNGGDAVPDGGDLLGDGDDDIPGMIPIPAGTFWMGCNDSLDSECFSSEEPYHLVTVPAFEIDVYEVTVSEYRACVDANGCTPSDPDGATFFWSYCTWDAAGKEDHPINCVTWHQARDYCAFNGKRLCTEAEWEKASRGGCELYTDCPAESRVYPWGNQAATCDYAVMDDGGHACGTQSTFPVGSKPLGASPYGVMDLSGNVCEWVRDCYFGDYVGDIDNVPPIDGSAWETPGCADLDKVARGGSWYDFPHTLRSSQRLWREPAGNTGTQGFRCCR